ncbi:MAG: tRNA pseudouridine(38-40) synthase TruA [Pseudomonadales bacterium]
MNLALGVEYDGSAFHGFQRQSNAPSVQQALEEALARIADHPVRVAAAGRTDRGVHATGQVVSLQVAAERPLRAWWLGTNSHTPPQLKVRWARAVSPEFHARYSAVARRYQYLFYEAEASSPLLEPYAVRAACLDDDAMHAAAQTLLGEHDFSAFRAAGCQSLSAHRCVHRISVHRCGALVVMDITANAFLLHMVRNIAGVLQQVGSGVQSPDWVRALLLGRDRNLAGRTAPAHGLYFLGAHYPGVEFPAPELPGLLRALGTLDRF